jgi:hypothetical protein
MQDEHRPCAFADDEVALPMAGKPDISSATDTYRDISDKTCACCVKQRALGDIKIKKRQFLLPLAVSVSALISGTGDRSALRRPPLDPSLHRLTRRPQLALHSKTHWC